MKPTMFGVEIGSKSFQVGIHLCPDVIDVIDATCLRIRIFLHSRWCMQHSSQIFGVADMLLNR